MPDLFSIQLFFPVAKARCALEAVAKVVDGTRNRANPGKLPGSNEILLVPIDRYVKDYLDLNSYTDADSILTIDGVRYGRVSNISIRKQVSEQYVELSIGAQLSNVNPILQHSPELHRQMLHVLNMCEGYFGVVDTGQAEMQVLGKPDVYLVVDPDLPTERVDHFINTAHEQFDWLTL